MIPFKILKLNQSSQGFLDFLINLETLILFKILEYTKLSKKLIFILQVLTWRPPPKDDVRE